MTRQSVHGNLRGGSLQWKLTGLSRTRAPGHRYEDMQLFLADISLVAKNGKAYHPEESTECQDAGRLLRQLATSVASVRSGSLASRPARTSGVGPPRTAPVS